MSIGSEASRLMKIDELIKGGLEDEIQAMKAIYGELAEGLKKIKGTLGQTTFDKIGEGNAEEILKPAQEAIEAFSDELSPLDSLDNRFASIKEHAITLKQKLEEFKNTLSVYGSSEKAMIDFNNHVLYQFKVTIERDFEQDIDFNKRIEEQLK